VPQRPQLRGSLVRSRQTPVQLVWPAAQLSSHALLTQVVPAAHTRPQTPQLLLSLVSVRHTPEQLVLPVVHDTEHTPDEHT
jgi:hypothetical protein